jgi:hypothetical protein
MQTDSNGFKPPAPFVIIRFKPIRTTRTHRKLSNRPTTGVNRFKRTQTIGMVQTAILQFKHTPFMHMEASGLSPSGEAVRMRELLWIPQR